MGLGVLVNHQNACQIWYDKFEIQFLRMYQFFDAIDKPILRSIYGYGVDY